MYVGFKRPLKIFISKSMINTLQEKGELLLIISSYDKLKKLFENSKEPLTSSKISKKLKISKSNISEYLKRLCCEGFIKIVKIDKSTKYYVSMKYYYRYKVPVLSSYDKIMNFISNSNEPFTKMQLTVLLNLTYDIVRHNISKTLEKGHVKPLGRLNGKYYFISSEVKVPLLSSYAKIKNYIYYSDTHFTASKISDETGLSNAIVHKYLRKFVKVGFVKQIGVVNSVKVYIRNKIKI
jgi:DNA-binding transcriptional regulator GbsR (MarR family)